MRFGRWKAGNDGAVLVGAHSFDDCAVAFGQQLFYGGNSGDGIADAYRRGKAQGLSGVD